MIVRLGHFVLWLLVSVLILLAVLVTALRVSLPHINRYQGEITQWVNQQTNINFSIDQIDGFWRNAHPAVSVKNMKANLPDASNIHFHINQLDVEFDLLESLLQWQPVVAKLDIHHSDLDISSVDLLALQSAHSDEQLNHLQSEQQEVLHRLDNIFLRQLGEFTLVDSKVRYTSFAGEHRELLIDHLKWQNEDQQHRVEGIVSVANTGFNSLGIKARFEDYDSFKDLSGDFYVSAEKVNVGSWLTKYLKDRIGVKSGTVSFNAWLTLEHNKARDGYVRINPSQLRLSTTAENQISVNSGIIKLNPMSGGGVQLLGENIAIQTDDAHWPELNFVSTWHQGQLKLNIKQFELAPLLPLMTAAIRDQQGRQVLTQLSPGGEVNDFRLSYSKSLGLAYSAHLLNGGIQQWELLPETHKLQAHLVGNEKKALITADLMDDTLPYGDVFQAPLVIDQGHVNLVWQNEPNGWSLWSDHVAVATPELNAIGAFKLDFEQGKSPFLSFYAEADVANAGETWRYLPTLALGTDLTNYLSAAIQAGQVHTAKLVWYGPVFDFPYHQHNGVFQAAFQLHQGKFSFDTAWPALDNLQANFLFENDSLVFDSNAAESMGVKARHVMGKIAHMDHSGLLTIQTRVDGDGSDVRDYMMATPLVDSVGAALTTLKVAGQVTSEFQLTIPFDLNILPRAWGWADLSKNAVAMPSLSINLSDVTGRIYFDNDVIKSTGVTGQLLDQPVTLGFNGENQQRDYHVHIDTSGDWNVKPLAPYVGKAWIDPLVGKAPWKMGVDVQLNDVGFTYQVDLKTDLKQVKSRYPAPLDKARGMAATASLQASGNQEAISARVQLPHAKYQAEIDISKAKPVLAATNLLVGKGSFKVSPIVGHYASIRTDQINLDHWIDFIRNLPTFDSVKSKRQVTTSKMPDIPMPDHIAIQTKVLTLASLEWHDVDFLTKHKSLNWELNLSSQEMEGTGIYTKSNALSLNLSKLHVYVPALEHADKKDATVIGALKNAPAKVTDLEKTLYRILPDLTLSIHDFWLQGYKVGAVTIDMQRQKQALELKNINIVSGTNNVHATGSWTLKGNDSHTQFVTHLEGDNNSEVMERFGISSGIQKASFDISTKLAWKGSPWTMQIDSLKGHIDTQFGKGFVSDVNGTAKLLGLFSLDSIIRKMKLDFSDVFDKGMAFDSIDGSGDIAQGVFVTNNLKMDAVAGEMSIKGLADLNSRTIDAEVSFVPDITSGIPVLSAFAVTPVTALYVLAITTVISPVVEVFTEVNYEVKGPIDSPSVKETSRSKGEFKLPKDFIHQVEEQHGQPKK